MSMTLPEYQKKEDESQRRWEEVQATIPDLAEDNFNALSLIYTKPLDRNQYCYMQDYVDGVTMTEWQGIARALRDRNILMAGELLDIAMHRICLKRAEDDVSDRF